MKKIITMSLVATFALTGLQAATNAELEARVADLESKLSKTDKTLKAVKIHDAFDNIKFGVDFRNAVDVLDYKDNDTGETASNSSLLTSRLYLTMAAAPTEGLIFKGKLAIYGSWGSHLFAEDSGVKDWSASSTVGDTAMRVKEAYFVYSTDVGEQPISLSIGRRPSSNGFLANYRENEPEPGSPLAHITNMEVNAAMVRLSWDRFVSGAYTKFVYGRAHSGDTTGVYSIGHTNPWGPNAKEDGDDENVDFALALGDVYNDGQYQIMYQWAHIFDTKGQQFNDPSTKKAAAGEADLFSIGLKIDGIGDEISDFLDETTVFISGAYTNYNAKNGYQLLGSSDGGSQDGSSIWVGAVMPDMITDSGRFGIEYNHGSKYWTPMTWAEDTAIGSKIAVRGDAYEAYWNFDLFGVKYLPSQIRYTYAQHDYTPNVNCAGWVDSEKVDITAQDLRFAITYRY
jgi:hypothetical protein